jgi:hypothetical protein
VSVHGLKTIFLRKKQDIESKQSVTYEGKNRRSTFDDVVDKYNVGNSDQFHGKSGCVNMDQLSSKRSTK